MVDSLQDAVLNSLLGEASALKPGNVSRFADGHGMTHADFELSAHCVAPILCTREGSMGERLYRAVDATMTAVGCNTNLGMLLLYLPIIEVFAAGERPADAAAALHACVAAVDREDTARFFAAITLASPGGLGHSRVHDVRDSPETGLLEAMTAARERDMIAAQYCTGFRQVLDFGLTSFHDYAERWNSVEWATVACYLSWMVNFTDSHISRKHGASIAEQTRKNTVPVFDEFIKYKSPGQSTGLLLEYDKELKASNINPGTSADLTAATLLLYNLGVKRH